MQLKPVQKNLFICKILAVAKTVIACRRLYIINETHSSIYTGQDDQKWWSITAPQLLEGKQYFNSISLPRTFVATGELASTIERAPSFRYLSVKVFPIGDVGHIMGMVLTHYLHYENDIVATSGDTQFNKEFPVLERNQRLTCDMLHIKMINQNMK